MKGEVRKVHSKFEKFANVTTRFTGSSLAFIIACTIILTWGICGPFFHFSEIWQMVINTATTIITFLMVFIIQHSQNKDSLAIQLKLNEIVAALEGASNRLINAENLTDEELRILHQYYTRLSVMSKKEEDLRKSHSVEEAQERHKEKQSKFPPRLKK